MDALVSTTVTTDAPSPAVNLRDHDGVAVISLDDGKANALGHEVLRQLDEALRAATDAKAVALLGRPGKFCAGFDLKVMQTGPQEAIGLMARGAEVALRLFELPRPCVLGVTGHALAMGAVLLSCGDVRIGAEGDFKLGLNEVAIGLAMPVFALELSRTRLAASAFHEATALARIYSPTEAGQMGYLDEVVPPQQVEQRVLECATELGDRLDQRAFAATRVTMRAALADELRRGLGLTLDGITDG
jgi:enoyl-CoA hydratase